MADVAIVTGASKGIGAAVARRLLVLGWSVVVNARGDEALRQFCEETGPESNRIRMVVGDVARVDIRRTLREVAQSLGSLRLLVNNAGGASPKGFLDSSIEDLDVAIDVDLRSTWALSREVSEVLIAKRGSIVNITSLTGTFAPHGRSMYSIAKGSQIAATRAMAMDLAPFGVRVNSVSPGPTATEGFIALSTESDRENRGKHVPMGRLANRMTSLASSDSSPAKMLASSLDRTLTLTVANQQ